MRAIILAAGEGSRLRPYTRDRPKCLVELAGRPLLAHQLAALATAGIDDVTVVTGCRREQIEALGHPTLVNPDYAVTNMVATLLCAADLLDGGGDVVVAYADIVYEPRIVEALAACPASLATTVDRSWRRLWSLRFEEPLLDAETMKIDPAGDIVELGKKPGSYKDIQGQFMGLVKIGAGIAPEIVRAYRELDPRGPYDGKDRANMYMTSFLQLLIDHGQPLRAVRVDGGWLEVDTAKDLELFERLDREGALAEYWRPAGGPGDVG